MRRQSAAYIIVIVSVTSFIVGALSLTTVDPVMQALFDSPSYSSTTSYGTNSLQWWTNLWGFVPAALLIGILITVWIETRQPT